jgi:hypothetical protein
MPIVGYFTHSLAMTEVPPENVLLLEGDFSGNLTLEGDFSGSLLLEGS